MITMSLTVMRKAHHHRRFLTWEHLASSLKKHSVEHIVYAGNSPTSQNPTIPEQSLRVSQNQADFAQTGGLPRSLRVFGSCRGQRRSLTVIPVGNFHISSRNIHPWSHQHFSALHGNMSSLGAFLKCILWFLSLTGT